MNEQSAPQHRPGADHTATNVIAAIGITVTTPVVTAWLLGDLSEAPAGVQGDYFIRPPDLGAGEHVIGALCATIDVIALGWLVHTSRSRRLDPRWWFVIGALMAAGALIGFAWRVMTAASIGANIGVGLVVFFGGPILLGLLVWAVVWSAYLLKTGRRQADQSRADA